MGGKVGTIRPKTNTSLFYGERTAFSAGNVGLKLSLSRQKPRFPGNGGTRGISGFSMIFAAKGPFICWVRGAGLG